MNSTIIDRLNQFYLEKGIHPSHFRCTHQTLCRSHSNPNKMIETKMSSVGHLYGTKYPKIVVVSLDPPGQQGKFSKPEHRTVEYFSDYDKNRNYSVDRPDSPHWAMTLIIVKDLLIHFGYRSMPNAAVVSESYSRRPIDNVIPYFAHVNLAKCSMNYEDARQAPRIVHDTCSKAYLFEELAIFQPDILVSQGKNTNEILGTRLIGRPVLVGDLPITYKVTLGNKQFLWLPMHHPTQQQSKIRHDWSVYDRAVREWVKA